MGNSNEVGHSSRLYHARRFAHIRHLLCRDYPGLFLPQGSQESRKPLAKWVTQAIIEDSFCAWNEVSPKELRQTVSDYVAGTAYLSAIQAGAPTYDIHGNKVGVVGERAARIAREALRERDSEGMWSR